MNRRVWIRACGRGRRRRNGSAPATTSPDETRRAT
jgi:hypothetical protein